MLCYVSVSCLIWSSHEPLDSNSSIHYRTSGDGDQKHKKKPSPFFSVQIDATYSHSHSHMIICIDAETLSLSNYLTYPFSLHMNNYIHTQNLCTMWCVMCECSIFQTNQVLIFNGSNDATKSSSSAPFRRKFCHIFITQFITLQLLSYELKSAAHMTDKVWDQIWFERYKLLITHIF